jgi:hypothetical protein
MINHSWFQRIGVYARSEDAWAAQLGTTGDPSKIDNFAPLLLEPSPKLEGNEVVTSEGKPLQLFINMIAHLGNL